LKQYFEKEVDRVMEITGSSGSLYDAIDLLITTGRRIGELCESDYRLEEGVLQYIPLKKRDREWCSILEFSKEKTPLEVYTQIQQFQRENTQPQKILGQNVIRFLNTSGFKTIKSSHDFRKIYSQILTKDIRPQLKSTFIKNLLCHSNVQSSIHYNQAVILPVEEKKEIVEEKEIVEVKEDIFEKRDKRVYCKLCQTEFSRLTKHKATKKHQLVLELFNKN
jgi:hypothetical protein